MAAAQELALGRVLGPGDRHFVRPRRLGVSPDAPEQVGADGVKQVVTLQLQVFDQGADGVPGNSDDRSFEAQGVFVP